MNSNVVYQRGRNTDSRMPRLCMYTAPNNSSHCVSHELNEWQANIVSRCTFFPSSMRAACLCAVWSVRLCVCAFTSRAPALLPRNYTHFQVNLSTRPCDSLLSIWRTLFFFCCRSFAVRVTMATTAKWKVRSKAVDIFHVSKVVFVS